MYLLAFAVLIISMIGVYTQVLAVQTARVFAHQDAVGLAMLEWQTAAVSMAASIIKTNYAAYSPLATTGCSLSTDGVTGFPNCPSPKNGAAAIDSSGTVTNGITPNQIYNTTTNTVECVHLPVVGACQAVYDTLHYRFDSVLYQDANGHNFVVTLVPVPAGGGYITLASGTLINIRISDLAQQVQNTGKATYQFGGINSAQQLVVSGTYYTLPAGFAAYANALAVIASPDGF